MTKAEIISFVRNNLRKIDQTAKYHRVVVEKAITLAFVQGYGDVFERDPRLLDNFTVTYGISPAVTTSLDSTMNIYKATLPVQFVPFKDKASGVRNVFTQAKSTTKFYPMSKYELDIADNTMFGEIDDRIGYCVHGTQLLFYRMTGVTNVRIDVVQQFDEYDDDDEVMIPFAKDMQLVTAVIELLRGIQPVDTMDDNSDMKWQTQQR